MNRAREALVGGVVLAALATGVAGTIWLRGGWGSEGQAVLAASPSLGQLVEGASVKFRGVTVGRVDVVAVAPGSEAVLVSMTIDPELAIPKGAAVLLAPESMFGDWQAEIVDRDEFPRLDFLDYPEEGVLPGIALPDMSRLTATADEIAQNLTVISDRVQLAFTEETALNLRRAIDNIGSVSDGLSEILDQQAARFNMLADGVDESARELGAAASAARAAFDEIGRIVLGPEVESLLADAGVSAENLRGLTGDLAVMMVDLRAAASQADSTFARLDRLLAMAEEGDGAMARFLSDPELAESTLGAVDELRSLLADIQENPGRYLKFSVF